MIKELTLSSVIALVLVGCLSDDEKKAKDIAVKNIIQEDKRLKVEKSNKGKSADFRGFSTKAWDK